MALRRVWIYSPNFTSGNNGRRLLVIHSSEGAQTYQSLGSFFSQASSQVSSHVGIDDTRGTIGEYVTRGSSAWTASGANMVSIQAELCTPSGASNGWSRSTWLSHDNMLRNLADWLREESAATGIPLTELTPKQAQGSGRGICEHKDLGAWGGGHVDCGPNFPMDYVMDLVRGKVQETEEETVAGQLVIEDGNRAVLVFTNKEADGKHRLRLGSRLETVARLDWIGVTAETTELRFDYNTGPRGSDIPDGCQMVVIKIDAPVDPATGAIAWTVSG